MTDRRVRRALALVGVAASVILLVWTVYDVGLFSIHVVVPTMMLMLFGLMATESDEPQGDWRGAAYLGGMLVCLGTLVYRLVT